MIQRRGKLGRLEGGSIVRSKEKTRERLSRSKFQFGRRGEGELRVESWERRVGSWELRVES
jgi:hypothetical protein